MLTGNHTDINKLIFISFTIFINYTIIIIINTISFIVSQVIVEGCYFSNSRGCQINLEPGCTFRPICIVPGIVKNSRCETKVLAIGIIGNIFYKRVVIIYMFYQPTIWMRYCFWVARIILTIRYVKRHVIKIITGMLAGSSIHSSNGIS